jgi:mono/diheme cytochrome c family protein
MKRLPLLLIATAAAPLLGLLAACGHSPDKVPITAADRAEAAEIFASRCAVCHGLDGKGDGPGGAALVPKPRNYHDKAWQAATTDEEIEKAIVYGGTAVGKSPQMAPNPDLEKRPGVVAALCEKVRSFADQ